MSNDLDAIEASFDEADFGEFEEAFARPAVRTPSSRSSFAARTAPSAASQGQVQAAARNLDSKIETLSNAVKALEARTNAVSAKTDRTATALARESAQRRKAEDAIRADVQQTRMLSVLLPLINDTTVDAVDSSGTKHSLLARPTDGFSSLVPLLVLLPGLTGGDAAKGPFGGDILTTLLLFKTLGKS